MTYQNDPRIEPIECVARGRRCRGFFIKPDVAQEVRIMRQTQILRTSKRRRAEDRGIDAIAPAPRADTAAAAALVKTINTLIARPSSP